MSEITTKILNNDDFLELNNWNFLNTSDFPFQSYEFLCSLINSKSIHKETGQEFFVIAAFNKENLLGAIPCYIKYHSYGEYLFDWQWANHFQMNKIPYYPKLVAYSPFTPIIGPKFLAPDDENNIKKALLKEFTAFATHRNCFSASFLYPTPEEAKFLERQDIAPVKKRINYQYNWQNKNYADFDGFLMDLKKSKRKNIKKERLSIKQQALEIRMIPKDELKSYAKKFYPFYLSTVDKKYAHAYLTQELFEAMFTTMPENILLFEATQENQIVAMSLSLKNNKEVFGRYWGCLEEFKNLHFEMCYYQNIEYAIKNKLQRVQAGAQGTHKIPRGFLPEEVCSFHWFIHPQVNQSIQNYIAEENKQISALQQELSQMSPFKTK